MGMRPARVREALRREVSLIVQKEITDPRLGFITVTKVEISRDLKTAIVYYSVLGEDKDVKGAYHALKSAGGYIRKLIGDRVKMKYVPEIRFEKDKSLEHTQRIYEILDDIKKKTDGDKDPEDSE